MVESLPSICKTLGVMPRAKTKEFINSLKPIYYDLILLWRKKTGDLKWNNMYFDIENVL